MGAGLPVGQGATRMSCRGDRAATVTVADAKMGLECDTDSLVPAQWHERVNSTLCAPHLAVRWRQPVPMGGGPEAQMGSMGGQPRGPTHALG